MSKKFAALLLSSVMGVIAGSAIAADGQWQKDHPRRAEVNGRLSNQDKRIHNEVKSGEISKSQAAGLHKEDHQVRQEERDMSSQNSGHITKQEQKTLNKQENGISHQIGS
ncbi:hypothetical protein [Pseudomonas sp. NA-150]|uniref:hypothetical protein n=1 Tax=Pseudomonas sp. NA-150 TaxID=3367525 RepID=UPI0037C93617